MICQPLICINLWSKSASTTIPHAQSMEVPSCRTVQSQLHLLVVCVQDVQVSTLVHELPEWVLSTLQVEQLLRLCLYASVPKKHVMPLSTLSAHCFLLQVSLRTPLESLAFLNLHPSSISAMLVVQHGSASRVDQLVELLGGSPTIVQA